jgi:hypothetical protein
MTDQMPEGPLCRRRLTPPQLHVVIPDITRTRWQVNICEFAGKAEHLADVVRLG